MRTLKQGRFLSEAYARLEAHIMLFCSAGLVFYAVGIYESRFRYGQSQPLMGTSRLFVVPELD